MQSVVLSHVQARPLLAARAAHHPSARVSLDLNLSLEDVTLGPEGASLPDGQQLAWSQIEHIAGSDSGCFQVTDSAITKVQAFSDLTNRVYSLYPTQAAPTMLVSGLPMHRIKDTDPYQDTLTKIKAAALTHGRTLDTCTGLGYTAIEAAKVSEDVITIELDPAAQVIARQNPWSQRLFEQTSNIKQVLGDALDVVETFEAATFSRIIHDPPTFALGGELYGEAFYHALRRVLKPGGKLFHYIGDLDSTSGSRVARGAIERLKRAGFARVTPRPEAFGLVATAG